MICSRHQTAPGARTALRGCIWIQGQLHDHACGRLHAWRRERAVDVVPKPGHAASRGGACCAERRCPHIHHGSVWKYVSPTKIDTLDGDV
eukprot:350193-Chlamydomonas_euryale.AAC.2